MTPETIVVFTAICGRFNNVVREPLFEASDAYLAPRYLTRFVCFSDSLHASEVPAPYELLPTAWEHDSNPRRTSRYHKVNSHLLFPNAAFTLWHDGSHQLMAEPWSMAASILGLDNCPKVDFAAFRHPERSSPYQELVACIRLNKDDPAIMRAQIDRYRIEGLPAECGLFETSVVLRRNRRGLSDEINRFNDCWWREIRDGSVRDQLSVNYAAWRSQVKTTTIRGNRVESPYFCFHAHR